MAKLVENELLPQQTKSYTYNEIDSNKEFRILEIYHGAKDEPLRGSLITRSLPSTTGALGGSYGALSYQWDRDSPCSGAIELYEARFTEMISLTSFPARSMFYVREHLFSGLRSLRDAAKNVYVWVDMLCINQENKVEKAAQVARMAEIYSSADTVYLWLGEDDTGKALETFDFLQRIVSLKSSDRLSQETLKGGWPLVAKLLQNRYFGRRWLIQELTLAKRAEVRWGEAQLEWFNIVEAMKIYRYIDIKDLHITDINAAFDNLSMILGQPTSMYPRTDARSSLANNGNRGELAHGSLVLKKDSTSREQMTQQDIGLLSSAPSSENSYSGESDCYTFQNHDSTRPSSLNHSAQEEELSERSVVTTFLNYRQPEQNLRDEKRDNDYESVVSDGADVNSTADSLPNTTYKHAASTYIVKTFAADPHLCILYGDAAQVLGEEKFIRNHKRLLKALFKGLVAETPGASEILAIRFLKSAARRTTISSDIYRVFTPSDNTIQEKVDGMIKQDADKLTLLNRYLEQADFETKHHERESDQDLESDTTDSDSDDGCMLPKLEQTAAFLVSGKPFDMYKDQLRTFLHPNSPQPVSQEGLIPPVMPLRPVSDDAYELDTTRYSLTISHLLSLLIAPLERSIENFIGCELSWWPLSDPEPLLQSGHVRVYSARGRQLFSDDIPDTLACRLFPRLAEYQEISKGRSAKFTSDLDTPAVYLRGTTLGMCLHELYCATSIAQEDITSGDITDATEICHDNLPAMSQPLSGTTSTAEGLSITGGDINAAPTGPVIDTDETPVAAPITPSPVIFLSVNRSSNQTIACSVVPGPNDTKTLEVLRNKYKKLSAFRWATKRIRRVKFYRFESFLSRSTEAFHHVNLHNDKERYPQKEDPQFKDYRYAPRPWPAEWPFPNNEFWHFFTHPEDCGTSTYLTDTLPTRVKGAITQRDVAFGIHFVERYSVLVILLPVAFVSIASFAVSLWFFKPWLATHPDDLQNAAVPFSIVSTVVNTFISLIVSLLVFRWTVHGE